MLKIQRALISCWDKTGLPELAAVLQKYGVEIISSGGTATFLQEQGIPVTTVESITGYPEILDGRVKTLHPAIHGAILATDQPHHQQQLKDAGIQPVQLVVVNLYPFVQEAIRKNLPIDQAIEYIDIGGPAMLRAAAKNYRFTLPLHRPEMYEPFIRLLEQHEGSIPEDFRIEMARQVFFYTAWYDGMIQQYFSQKQGDTGLPAQQALFLERQAELRYGENPHQRAAFYVPFNQSTRGMAHIRQLWGKQLSFNNYVDVAAAYQLVAEFDKAAVAIIKHTNPCGVALDDASLLRAYQKALQGDPVSAFGGIVALNRVVDEATASEMSRLFLECIIAPGFDPGALKALQRKKNVRLLELPIEHVREQKWDWKQLPGAFLIQNADNMPEDFRNWKVVTETPVDEALWKELIFAWKVVKHVKSNAIVLAKGEEVYGVGAGQMSRVDAVELAIQKAQKAGRQLQGMVLASDAFFPFRDGIDLAARHGVIAVIQPGGSVRDAETIQAANEHKMAMVFTGTRHFKH
ncbi:MAG: bifunctional phosphoribosylaminoimidazolecarboxamide formyltransferase/IMP cyclohydrolase [Calditrichaeota bacterium]|nr:bifunctional phosphoribosylaminoimidazolecarboxamide formyltransferase/IMP cyclohydrolase [Calditrichota bacterium]